MNKIIGIAFDEKKPVLYRGSEAYDGEKNVTMTEELRKQIRSLRTPYILVPVEKSDKREFKEIYEEFIREANEMKKQTNGKINMYKSGRDVQTAMKLAYDYLNEKGIEAEKVTYDEYKWLEDASHGPIVFGEEYEGKAYTYDFNSHYPSIYSDYRFNIPIKKGEFRHVTKEEMVEKGYYDVGIYKATVTYPDNKKNYKKVFRLNNKNKYTHIDLNRATKLGLNIQLSTDNPNLLHYSKDKYKSGKELFGSYVNLLYPLRSNPIIKNRCKSLLRCLWGALSQNNLYKFKISFDEEFELFESRELVDLTICEDYYEIKTIRKDSPYETPYARIKPFLLAKGRVKISEKIEPDIEYIKKCHTDSMISSKELNIKTSLELGKMKLEKVYSRAIILNSQRMLSFDNPKDNLEIIKYYQDQLKQDKIKTKRLNDEFYKISKKIKTNLNAPKK